QDFAGAVLPTLIALLGSITMVIGFVGTQILVAEGRGVAVTVIQSLSLVVGIGLLIAVGPVLGAVGASIASTVGFIVACAAILGVAGIRASRSIPHPRDVVAGMKTLMSRRDTQPPETLQ